MNKIIGIDSAYTSAVEKRGMNMVITASLVEEIVDRIRELEKENATLREGMKGDYDLDAWLDWVNKYALSGWISVEDRLPILKTDTFENYEQIDVIAYDGRSVFPALCSAGRHGVFWCELDGAGITHWMPLPPLPLNEEQG